MIVYLVEIEGVQPDGTLATRYFCTGTGYVSGPQDIPANRVYEPRVLDPGTYERHLWKPGQTQGAGYVAVGAIQLVNADGALDGWIDWDFDGRPVRILRGDDAAPRTAFAAILTGTTQSVSLALEVVQINLRDRMAELAAVPAVTARYGGTNSLPDGVDGTADDIKGQFRPWLLGDVQGISAPRVNSSRLIYELSQHAIAEVVAVYEGGNAITAGSQRADVATLQSTSPTAGTYDWTLGSATEGAYIRLGSSPSLAITADAREGAAAADRTIGQIAARVMQACGIDAASTAALADFDDVQPAVVGYWIGTSGAAAGDVLDALCASGGAAWTVRRDGRFEILRLELPAGQPVASFGWPQMLDTGSTPLALLPTDDTTGGVPVYEIDLSYAQNYTVLTGSQVAGAVSAARVDFLAQQYRQVTASAPAIWDPASRTGRNPLSQPLAVTTQLVDQADAQAEADRLIGIYGARRHYLSVSVPAALAGDIDLGDVVTLAMPRFGASAGQQWLVTGMVEDRANATVELFCWR